MFGLREKIKGNIFKLNDQYIKFIKKLGKVYMFINYIYMYFTWVIFFIFEKYMENLIV